MKIRNLTTIAAAALLLAACGGGGGTDMPAPDTNSVPDSASASVAGLTSWLMRLTRTNPEDQEALDLMRFAPPRPDDAEPEALR